MIVKLVRFAAQPGRGASVARDITSARQAMGVVPGTVQAHLVRGQDDRGALLLMFETQAAEVTDAIHMEAVWAGLAEDLLGCPVSEILGVTIRPGQGWADCPPSC